MTRSILHDWVMNLGLRKQGVLLASIRGCDGVPKHDLSKPVMRAVRFLTIVNFDMRETTNPKGFTHWDPALFWEGIEILAKNLDEYPCHFVFHLIHALEIIGYYMPKDAFKDEPEYQIRCDAEAASYFCRKGYEKLVKKFHLNPETLEQLEERMNEDRVANGTVAG